MMGISFKREIVKEYPTTRTDGTNHQYFKIKTPYYKTKKTDYTE
jgi:hypothetical protein